MKADETKRSKLKPGKPNIFMKNGAWGIRYIESFYLRKPGNEWQLAAHQKANAAAMKHANILNQRKQFRALAIAQLQRSINAAL